MSHSMIYKKDKNCQIYHVIWRPSWILPIKKVAQGYRCQSGNQARIVLESPQNKNHQKKFIGKNISRLGNFQIDYFKN